MAAATAIALGATSVASAGASFAQAAKQQRQMREAEEAAAKYMDDARKKFSVNFAEQLQVPLEGYEMASDLNRQAVSQNIEALRESGQRAVLGGVAGLQQQAQAGAEQLRMAMQQDLYERDKAIAAEESRLRDIQGEIDLGEAAGAQQAAADAQMMRAQSIQSGLGALASGATSLYEGSDLYKQSKETKLAEKFGKGLTVDQKSALSDKFSNLSRGQRKFLEQADPDTYSPFLQTPEALSKANLASLGGIKKGALGQMKLPKLPTSLPKDRRS
jgi:hypothetical protein